MSKIDIDKFIEHLVKFGGLNCNAVQSALFEQGLILSNYKIQKIGENSPTQAEVDTDKIEPKFKVGNWYQCIKDFFGKGVTFDKDTAYYCAQEGCLQNEYGCHIAIDENLYDNFKLWKIEDAQDGDILAYVTDEEDLWIMIYWSLYEPYEGHVHYHALLVNDDFYDKGTCCICINDLKPATKEQRESLFKKIKEARYAWNPDEKKLNKIENDVQLTEFEDAIKDMMDDYRDAIGDNDVTIEEVKKHAAYLLSLIHKKSSWNEEDSFRTEALISVIRSGGNIRPELRDEFVNWIELLKNRIEGE